MILTEARAIVTQFARNAAGASAVYSTAEIDRAILSVGNHFCRETRCVRESADQAVPAGNADVDLSGLAGFRADGLSGAYLEGVAAELVVIDFETYWRRSVQCPAAGVPSAIAFKTPTSAVLHPTPADDQTLTVLWSGAFESWTAGTATPNDVTLNVPDDWLAEILPYGPPAVLQHNEEKAKYASASWQKYLGLVERIKGEAGLGARVVGRANAFRGDGGGWVETGNVFGP